MRYHPRRKLLSCEPEKRTRFCDEVLMCTDKWIKAFWPELLWALETQVTKVPLILSEKFEGHWLSKTTNKSSSLILSCFMTGPKLSCYGKTFRNLLILTTKSTRMTFFIFILMRFIEVLWRKKEHGMMGKASLRIAEKFKIGWNVFMHGWDFSGYSQISGFR